MFQVIWSEEAYRDLGRVWVTSPRIHPHLRAARSALEYHLQNDPVELSEGRETDAIRIMFAFPLAILFIFDLEKKQTTVTSAWIYTLPS